MFEAAGCSRCWLNNLKHKLQKCNLKPKLNCENKDDKKLKVFCTRRDTFRLLNKVSRMHCMLMDLLHGFEVLSTTEETLIKLKVVLRRLFCRFQNSFFFYLTRNFANMFFISTQLIFFDVIFSSFLSSCHEKATEVLCVVRIQTRLGVVFISEFSG